MPAAKPDKISHRQQQVSYKWFRMYQTPLLQIVQDRDISGNTLRVYLALLSEMNFHNEIAISQKALAKMTKIAQPSISLALNKLEEKGIITKETNEHGIRLYKVNSSFALKGEEKPMRLVRN